MTNHDVKPPTGASPQSSAVTIFSLLLGFGQVLTGIISLAEQKAIGMGFLIAGLFAWTPISIFRKHPHRRSTRNAFRTCCLIASVILAATGVYFLSSQSSDNKGSIRIINPTPLATVSGCIAVQGTGTPPKEWEIWVTHANVAQTGDARAPYFTWRQTTWSSETRTWQTNSFPIGSAKDPKKRLSILAYLIPKDDAELIRSAMAADSNLNITLETIPGRFKKVASVTVEDAYVKSC